MSTYEAMKLTSRIIAPDVFYLPPPEHEFIDHQENRSHISFLDIGRKLCMVCASHLRVYANFAFPRNSQVSRLLYSAVHLGKPRAAVFAQADPSFSRRG